MSKKQRVSLQKEEKDTTTTRILSPHALYSIVKLLPFRERYSARRVSRFWKHAIDSTGAGDARNIDNIQEEILWLYNNPTSMLIDIVLAAVQEYMENEYGNVVDMMRVAVPPSALLRVEFDPEKHQTWAEDEEMGIRVGSWVFLLATATRYIICYDHQSAEEIELSDEWSRWALASALESLK